MTGLGRRALLAGTALAAGFGGRMAWAQSAAPARRPLLIPGKQTLFQRVIVRPGATLQSGPAAAPPGPAVPAFTTLYVYSRQGGDAGWVEIGPAADGRTTGWIAAGKLIEWPHAMVGAFGNPAGRQPVLFLGTREAEKALITGGDPGAAAARLLAAARAGQPGPVVAVEPANYIDITRQFYLLPILTAEQLETDSGASMRLLEVVSVPAEPSRTPPQNTADALRGFKAGLVFLIDTTSSMQPYIDATRDAVRQVIARIGTTQLRDKFRFGVIGYRDDPKENARLEYTTRVFIKPDFNLAPDAVVGALGNVREAPVSSAEFDEDTVAGMKTAIEEIDWNALGGRYVVVITDAGARDSTNPRSSTRLGIPEIKQLARERGIAVFVVHLLTPEGAAARDHPRAAAQYRALSAIDGASPLYFPVPNGNRQAFAATVTTLTDALIQQVAQTTGATIAAPGTAAAPPPTEQVQRQIDVVAQAMRLAYLGRAEQTRAPDVIRAFTADRDLADPTRRALGVRVLLTRNQLSDLAQALRQILDAGLASRTDPATFFGQLRTAFAVAARGGSQAQADRIGGMLGEYLDGLPYRSDIMNISQDDWLAIGGIKQADILAGVEAKLRLYQEFQEQRDLWVNLAGPDHPGEAAFPVPIEALP